MGKTETIKERTVWIYLPTLEQKNRWDEIATSQAMSLSKWIIKTIEDSLQVSKGDIKSREDIEMENKDLKKDIGELQKKIRQLTIIRENQDKELRKYRAEPFLTVTQEGLRQYDKELINLLRNAKKRRGNTRFVDNDEILARLDVGRSETDVIKAIFNQLSNLERYGLIESSTKGWRWKEQ